VPLTFTPSAAMSVGVEMELQLLDPETLDLLPAAPRLLERLGGSARAKPELFQSMLEIDTDICANAAEARRDLEATVARLREVCAAEGVRLASTGSHPFALHRERLLFPDERYAQLIDRNEWVARRLMIFGLHVHVGMRDGEHATQLLNGILPYLPHLLALSASSPFWQGSDTGLASSRTIVFEASPTAGHPCTYPTWKAFEALYDAMLAANAIRSIKDVWWDVRPHPDFGTVEVRVCDGVPSVAKTACVVALVHALFAWLDARHSAGERFAPPSPWILRENKWRASRWGLDARFVLDDSGRSAHARDEFEHLLVALAPVAARQGAADEFAGLPELLARPSYAHQREVFRCGGSCREVARAVAGEFEG
jgi:carboxylate-amine ligase